LSSPAQGHSDQWQHAHAGSGEYHLQVQYKPAPADEKLSIDSFELLKVIGKGSFGKVMQVRKKDTHRIYALKTIRKANIASRPGEITHILAERTVLSLVNNPYIVPLKFSFQTPDKLYLGMTFGAYLRTHIDRFRLTSVQSTAESSSTISSARAASTRQEVGSTPPSFCMRWSIFTASTLSIGQRHDTHLFPSPNRTFSDLKPENILLDYNGHIALCDFGELNSITLHQHHPDSSSGLCKLNMTENERTTSMNAPSYFESRRSSPS
jgi:serum/glucocorticoid-regulated kinase 2